MRGVAYCSGGGRHGTGRVFRRIARLCFRGGDPSFRIGFVAVAEGDDRIHDAFVGDFASLVALEVLEVIEAEGACEEDGYFTPFEEVLHHAGVDVGAADVGGDNGGAAHEGEEGDAGAAFVHAAVEADFAFGVHADAAAVFEDAEGGADAGGVVAGAIDGDDAEGAVEVDERFHRVIFFGHHELDVAVLAGGLHDEGVVGGGVVGDEDDGSGGGDAGGVAPVEFFEEGEVGGDEAAGDGDGDGEALGAAVVHADEEEADDHDEDGEPAEDFADEVVEVAPLGLPDGHGDGDGDEAEGGDDVLGAHDASADEVGDDALEEGVEADEEDGAEEGGADEEEEAGEPVVGHGEEEEEESDAEHGPGDADFLGDSAASEGDGSGAEDHADADDAHEVGVGIEAESEVVGDDAGEAVEDNGAAGPEEEHEEDDLHDAFVGPDVGESVGDIADEAGLVFAVDGGLFDGGGEAHEKKQKGGAGEGSGVGEHGDVETDFDERAADDYADEGGYGAGGVGHGVGTEELGGVNEFREKREARGGEGGGEEGEDEFGGEEDAVESGDAEDVGFAEEEGTGGDNDGDAGEVGDEHDHAAGEAVGEDSGEGAEEEEGGEHHDGELRGFGDAGFVGDVAGAADHEVGDELEHDDEVDAVAEGGDDVAGPEEEEVTVFEEGGVGGEEGRVGGGCRGGCGHGVGLRGRVKVCLSSVTSGGAPHFGMGRVAGNYSGGLP